MSLAVALLATLAAVTDAVAPNAAVSSPVTAGAVGAFTLVPVPAATASGPAAKFRSRRNLDPLVLTRDPAGPSYRQLPLARLKYAIKYVQMIIIK